MLKACSCLKLQLGIWATSRIYLIKCQSRYNERPDIMNKMLLLVGVHYIRTSLYQYLSILCRVSDRTHIRLKRERKISLETERKPLSNWFHYHAILPVKPSWLLKKYRHSSVPKKKPYWTVPLLDWLSFYDQYESILGRASDRTCHILKHETEIRTSGMVSKQT